MSADLIKKLVWDVYGNLHVGSPLGYNIRERVSDCMVITDTRYELARSGFAANYESVDEAKAACQARHEQFILSMLEQPKEPT